MSDPVDARVEQAPPAPTAALTQGDAIVVTYHSTAPIGACLESLLAAGLHVVVVDNGGTADLVRERFPSVDLIANDDNRGFAAAVNQGLARCDGEHVLLVNPDSIVPPATAAALFAYLDAHPDVGVVGPRLRDADGTLNISAQPEPMLSTLLLNRARRLLPTGFTRLLGRSVRWQSYDACLRADAATDVECLIGACLALPTAFLRELGGLDEGYFMYCEDLELCVQTRGRGRRVVYLPTVEAVHERGGSSGDRSHVWPLHARSLLRFHAIHRPRTFQLVRAALIGRSLLGLALGLAQDARDPDRRRTRAWRGVARIALAASRRELAA
ncbi:MAG TPA: glycosyltransferase family 2 protein [Gaiellaceae bacterium]|nr:glycosyltransferase family 2 protein [Gaiellaceae bacterium]